VTATLDKTTILAHTSPARFAEIATREDLVPYVPADWQLSRRVGLDRVERDGSVYHCYD